MADDQTSPATKQDIQMLMEHMGKLYDRIAQSEKSIEKKMEKKLEEKFEETKRHFDVTVEKIRHDLKGANKDQIEVLKDRSTSHEKRIVRLEQHAGLVAA
ncbi:hypothetical protein HY285_02600 [Candidatus Peregrinibacteria bacterium]|nr:hypothetical protein [Candidatus Peregrinibacteria bacterium]MBI3816411.1 hypothetical protein [Candidatus Peregrinibacteria bacterium]